jgi:hypothetical protein
MKKLNILFLYQFPNEKNYLTELSGLIKSAGALENYEIVVEIKPLNEILITTEETLCDILFVRAGGYKSYVAQIKKWVENRVNTPVVVITEPIQSKEVRQATDGMLYVIEPNIEKVRAGKDPNTFEKVFKTLSVITE